MTNKELEEHFTVFKKDGVKEIEEKVLDGRFNTQSQKLELKQKLQSLIDKL